MFCFGGQFGTFTFHFIWYLVIVSVNAYFMAYDKSYPDVVLSVADVEGCDVILYNTCSP